MTKVTYNVTVVNYKLTSIAIFLILFMAENCFKRDRTAESIGSSGATPSALIHGWSRR